MIPVQYENLFELTTQKIFEDIFNYTAITLRNNVKLTLLNKGKAVKSMIYNSIITAMMPDTVNQYYLFACDNVALNNLLGTTKQWVNIETLLNTNKVNIDFVTSSNKMIPKKLIYGYVDSSNVVIIAINIKAYSRLASTTETYLTINLDTDDVGDRTVISHIPGINNNINNLLARVNSTPEHQRLGFINGFVYRNDIFQTAGNSAIDYYELYCDGNVKFTFTVNLDERKTYMSSEENLYKDIIIIPQDLIHNKVCTYDTISIVVRTHLGKGVYLPFIADKSVSQLTHACFSISSYLIDAALDKLNATTGELLVIVSDYSKTNVNIPNGSVTEQLYHLSDERIMKVLTGDSNNQVDYWLANNLEKRMYGKYLTNIEELGTYDASLINRQIESLGYYPFTNLLCTHNGEINNLSSPVTDFTIKKPPFWIGVDLYPLVYLDGDKIPNDRYTVTQTDTHVNVTFDIPLPIYFTYSVLQYELIVEPKSSIYRCAPSDTIGSITIPKQGNTSLHVFYKGTYQLENIDGSEHFGYNKLFIENNVYYSIIEDDASYVFIFNNYAYGNEFVFMYDDITTINNHPNVDISAGKTLSFITTGKLFNSVDQLNILTPGEYEVYLNGRFMVDGIDYCSTLLKDDDTIGGCSITVQNLKFIKAVEANSVEIFKTDRKIVSSDTGYVVEGVIPRNINNEAWFKGISRLFVNGKLVPFDCVTVFDTHYQIDSKYSGNGYIYHFVNTVSNDFYNAYQPYVAPSYFTGRTEISEFFTRGYSYTYPNPIIITYGNRIFSSYLNEIIRRILDNTITVNYINDDEDIINQLINYEYLKEFDVFFKSDNKINQKFVDVYPGYLATVSTSDFMRYLYIQRLVKIILGSDTITDHMVVYTGN